VKTAVSVCVHQKRQERLKLHVTVQGVIEIAEISSIEELQPIEAQRMSVEIKPILVKINAFLGLKALQVELSKV